MLQVRGSGKELEPARQIARLGIDVEAVRPRHRHAAVDAFRRLHRVVEPQPADDMKARVRERDSPCAHGELAELVPDLAEHRVVVDRRDAHAVQMQLCARGRGRIVLYLRRGQQAVHYAQRPAADRRAEQVAVLRERQLALAILEEIPAVADIYRDGYLHRGVVRHGDDEVRLGIIGILLPGSARTQGPVSGKPVAVNQEIDLVDDGCGGNRYLLDRGLGEHGAVALAPRGPVVPVQGGRAPDGIVWILAPNLRLCAATCHKRRCKVSEKQQSRRQCPVIACHFRRHAVCLS